MILAISKNQNSEFSLEMNGSLFNDFSILKHLCISLKVNSSIGISSWAG